MTVAELIEELKKLPPDGIVMTINYEDEVEATKVVVIELPGGKQTVWLRAP